MLTFSYQNEARKMNHAEVVEEDKRSKLPKNWDAKRKRVEWDEGQEKLRKVRAIYEYIDEAGSCPFVDGRL